ncbi:MAG: DUF3127 domain-containing protein [Prevotellaceae bacterium]|nr:DUF3127 domain-containing protein [Prevotellaceae bacterium]
MEIKGKLIKKMPVVTGQGRNGEWRRQDVILETEGGQYPRKVCLTVWGDKVNVAAFNEGETLTAQVDIESREFNDKWYTSVSAWKIEPSATAEGSTPASAQSAPAPVPTVEPFSGSTDAAQASGEGEGGDDLPF